MKLYTLDRLAREEGHQAGLLEGQESGLRKGQVRMLLVLLKRKFGELDSLQKERVTYATPRELKQWTLRILDADSIEEVFG